MADALSDERARQGEANEPSGAGNGEHVLKFRNYRPRSDKIEYQKVGLAHPDKVEEPKPEVKIDQLASVVRMADGERQRMARRCRESLDALLARCLARRTP